MKYYNRIELSKLLKMSPTTIVEDQNKGLLKTTRYKFKDRFSEDNIKDYIPTKTIREFSERLTSLEVSKLFGIKHSTIRGMIRTNKIDHIKWKDGKVFLRAMCLDQMERENF